MTCIDVGLAAAVIADDRLAGVRNLFLLRTIALSCLSHPLQSRPCRRVDHLAYHMAVES